MVTPWPGGITPGTGYLRPHWRFACALEASGPGIDASMLNVAMEFPVFELCIAGLADCNYDRPQALFCLDAAMRVGGLLHRADFIDNRADFALLYHRF